MTERILVVAIVTTLVVQWTPTLAAQESERVEYFADSIAEKDQEYIRLLGGSSWLLSTFSTALVTDDIVVVFRDITNQGKRVTTATAYLGADEIPVRHVRGAYTKSTGYLTSVVAALGEGAVLRLADGSLLSVPTYDRYDTGWWLPPYKALLTSDRLYLYNLKEVKRVWVSPLK